MAEELGDQRLLGRVLAKRAPLLAHATREAVESGLRAAELLRSAGDLWNLAEVLWVTQFALLYLGRFDEAAEIGREAEPLADAPGPPGRPSVAQARHSGCGEFMVTGDINRFEEFAKADLELCRSAGSPAISNSYTYLGLVHFWRGEWGQALESFQEARQAGAPGPLGWLRLGATLPGEGVRWGQGCSPRGAGAEAGEASRAPAGPTGRAPGRCSSRRSKGWPSSVNERRPRSSTRWSWRPSIPEPSYVG